MNTYKIHCTKHDKTFLVLLKSFITAKPVILSGFGKVKALKAYDKGFIVRYA
jgi:hypothetical protein